MLKSNVAWSTDKDSYNAGKATAKKAQMTLFKQRSHFYIHQLIMMLKKY